MVRISPPISACSGLCHHDYCGNTVFPFCGCDDIFPRMRACISCCPDAAAADYMLQYHFFTFVICCLIPDDGGPSFLWGTWLALGYAGLRIESLWGMLYPFAVALVRMWRFNADGVAANEYFYLNLI